MSDTWKPLILGHRGARGLAPENTLPGFAVADEMGLPAAELDVHQTRDGAIVVIHDHTVDRTTDGTGRVESFSLKELRALDAAASWKPQFRGVAIPTLEEVFERYGKRFLWQVEFKVDDETPDLPGLVKKTADIVREFGIAERVTLTSFAPRALEQARHEAPDMERGLISSTEALGTIVKAAELGCTTVCLHQALLEPPAVEAVRAAGLFLAGWQGNSYEEMDRLYAARADGFSSDRPDIALAWLKEHGMM